MPGHVYLLGDQQARENTYKIFFQSTAISPFLLLIRYQVSSKIYFPSQTENMILFMVYAAQGLTAIAILAEYRGLFPPKIVSCWAKWHSTFIWSVPITNHICDMIAQWRPHIFQGACDVWASQDPPPLSPWLYLSSVTVGSGYVPWYPRHRM